jgi:hypothetical protein
VYWSDTSTRRQMSGAMSSSSTRSAMGRGVGAVGMRLVRSTLFRHQSSALCDKGGVFSERLGMFAHNWLIPPVCLADSARS